MRSPFDIFVIRTGWEFANTILLLVSATAFLLLAQTPMAHMFFAHIGDWGYAGAFLAGLFFASTFTVAPALLVLYALAHVLEPLPIALIAGTGAMLGDYIVFRFVRDLLIKEWMPVYCRIAGTPMGRVFSSPFFAWFAPVVGAFIIASPLPDEIGVSILGLARLKTWKMLALVFVLNTIGILAVVLIARPL